MLYQLDEIVFQRRSQRRYRQNPGFATSQLFQGVVQLPLRHLNAIPISRTHRVFRQPRGQFSSCRDVAQDFHALHFNRNDLRRRADPLQLSAGQYRHPVAQHFGVAEHVG